MMDRKKVLVIYGKNERKRGAIFAFLRTIGLHPFELRNQPIKRRRGVSYNNEQLQAALKDAHAVLVLLTGDDEAKLRDCWHISENDWEHEKTLYPQPRLNVLFEAGTALAKRPYNTILVQLGKLRLCSDLAGRNPFIELNDTREKRRELIEMLRSAGCSVDLSNRDWVDTGDFSDPDSRKS